MASVSSSRCECECRRILHRLLTVLDARTNNWSDYGGMDVYVSQILDSQYHDLFYTNSDVMVGINIDFHGRCSTQQYCIGRVQIICPNVRHSLQGRANYPCLGARQRAEVLWLHWVRLLCPCTAFVDTDCGVQCQHW